MKLIRQIVLISVPVSIVWTLSWFGVFTFLNGYVIKRLGYSNAEWSGLTLWFIGGAVFWKLIATELAARIGRRQTILAAMITSTFVWSVIGYIHSKLLIAFLLAVIGFMPAATVVVWFSMVASIGGNMPGRALAVNQIVASVTTALTMLLGGRLIGDDKYDMIFPVCGLLSAACALLFFVITKRIKDADGERVVSIFRLRREDVRGLLASSFPVIIVLGVFAEPLGFHAINQLFPNLARDVHGMSEFRISAVVALGRLPALASLFILAHYIDRLVPGIYYGLGIAIAGIAVVLMGSAGSVPVLLCGYILFYVGQGTVWGSNSAAVNSVVQARLRDSAYAVMSVCMYGSVFAIGSLHNMMIRHEYSLAMVFKACGMAAVASGAALAVYSAVSRSRK